MESWNIRDEILRSASQWYLVLAFLVVGGLIGFGISAVIPSPYRATADLYIGIDVVRVNEMEHVIPLAEEEPLNLDDYKNWQLKQVADIVTSSMVVKETLNSLREQDSYWNEITLDELQSAMDIYWYDTGTWQMEVVLPQEDQAVTAVQTWLDTGYGKISELLDISESGALLDNQLWSINTAIGTVKVRKARIKAFLSSSEEWILRLEDRDQDTPLGEELLQELSDWIRVYGEDDLYWQVPLENFPRPDQSVIFYLSWLADVQSAANISLEETQVENDILESERSEILPDYQRTLEDSLGLSANLVLLPDTSIPSVSSVRSIDTLTLGGGFIGFLAWLLFSVFRIRNLKEENA